MVKKIKKEAAIDRFFIAPTIRVVFLSLYRLQLQQKASLNGWLFA
ncbi:MULTISPECIES: hypothetical protein [Parageobacillus]|nr:MULTISPECIES: hypothetical protein [Parageobacillus]MED4988009.1 hypothetical protein [Parageobacillus toebii]